MNHKHIKALLLRYEAAETSLAEEAELRAYFNSDHIDDSLQQHAAYFKVQAVLAKAASPNFASGPWDVASSNEVDVAPAAKPASQLRVVHRRRNALMISLAAAAAIALLIALLLPSMLNKTATQPIAQDFTTPAQIDWSKYEVTDPTEAARITKAALVGVSNRMQTTTTLTKHELGRIKKPVRKAL